MTQALIIALQILLALGVYNVWLLRATKATAWRGGNARTLEEEFHAYGLSSETMRLVRACKLLCATALLLGVFSRPITIVAALSLSAFMLAAVVMHAKIHDPLRKAIPASVMLVLSLIVALGS